MSNIAITNIFSLYLLMQIEIEKENQNTKKFSLKRENIIKIEKKNIQI